jgi:alkanesulfonate monooxygenase SsuD/methylene tetrahydromethanopterin reductase-like flavin-dependent oxidoreductase (luciferase family)
MHVGLSVTFENPSDRLDDADVYHHELGFALQAEMWGFESVWVDEHHVSGHSVGPDPLQLLTYLAGQTRHILLGAGRLALPRRDPARLVEQIVLLDNVSAGRVQLGLAAGPSAVAPARVVLDALEHGAVEADGGDGGRPLRPRPERSFVGRVHADASEADLALLGALPMVDLGRPLAAVEVDLVAFGDRWRELTSEEPPPPIWHGPVIVDEDADRAEQLAGEHHAVLWGSAEHVIGELAALEAATGMAGLVAGLSFGGLPYEEAERNIACFVDEVMPALQAREPVPSPPERR